MISQSIRAGTNAINEVAIAETSSSLLLEKPRRPTETTDDKSHLGLVASVVSFPFAYGLNVVLNESPHARIPSTSSPRLVSTTRLPNTPPNHFDPSPPPSVLPIIHQADRVIVQLFPPLLCPDYPALDPSLSKRCHLPLQPSFKTLSPFLHRLQTCLRQRQSAPSP